MTLTLFDNRLSDGVTACDLWTANQALAENHYLGPYRGAGVRACICSHDRAQFQIWATPTSRHLNEIDGWELVRWCILPEAPRNAGSWFMGRVRRWLRSYANAPSVLVSYSELGHHDGALYKASGWSPWPTHHADRFMADGIGYPSGHGSWDGVNRQAPKMRWRIDL